MELHGMNDNILKKSILSRTFGGLETGDTVEAFCGVFMVEP